MQESGCPICNNQELKLIYKEVFPKRNLLKCNSCTSYYLWPKSTFTGDKEIYAAGYYNACSLPIAIRAISFLYR